MSTFVVNPNEYIFFEPDQVLTNDHLNQLFGYLDQQERWTRNKLIGVGIVCGLELSYDSSAGSISISGGVGITSQGYLINSCTPAIYTSVIPYVQKPLPDILPFTCDPTPFYLPNDYGIIYQLLNAEVVSKRKQDPCAGCNPDPNNPPPTQTQPQPITSITNLSDYVVVLFLEAQEKDLKNCNMQDCNNKGELMIFTLTPLLVLKKFINPNGANLPSKPKEIRFKRFNVPYTDLKNSTQILEAFLKIMDMNTLAEIEGALSYCYAYTSAYFPGLTNFPFTSTPGQYLHDTIDKILKTDPIFIQYCYDFLNDLILAYYEFREAAKCADNACCVSECLFPLHLVLGVAGTNTSSSDQYRQPFLKVAGCCQDGGINELQFLYNRMLLMVELFYDVYRASLFTREKRLQPVKITPSEYEFFPLSQRAIPYYYNQNKTGDQLYEYWNYERSMNGNAAFNLGYNAVDYNQDDFVQNPLKYDIEKYTFFRVEGHIGEQYQTALTNILSLRQQYNLPFDVVAISADMLDITGKLPVCQMQDLETDYRLIISEFACKVHNTFCSLSKLPFPIAQDQVKAQDFEAKKDSTGIVFNPLPGSLDFDNPNYQKGDFMRTFCPPVQGTIGQAYLGLINNTDFGTQLNNLLTSTPNYQEHIAMYTYYFSVFYFVNAVESLMYILMTNTIGTLDINESESTFTAAYQWYLITLSAVSAEFLAGTEGQTQPPYTAAIMNAIDQTISIAYILLSVCIDDRLQTLKNEYLDRLKNYESQIYFLNYFRKHPGLEHKAGVPKGGTFVLVYHDVSLSFLRPFEKPIEEQKASSTGLNLTETQVATLLKFVDDCGTTQTLDKISIIQMLAQVPPDRFRIPNGAIIADFYVPYLCCSDCAPVAYVLPQPPNNPQVPVIDMNAQYCGCDPATPLLVDSDSGSTVTADPSGTVNIVSINGTPFTGTDTIFTDTATGWQFTPAQVVSSTNVKAVIVFTYTLNGQTSNPATITVLYCPSSDFTASRGTDTSRKPKQTNPFLFSLTPVDNNTAFTYQWTTPALPDGVKLVDAPTVAVQRIQFTRQAFDLMLQTNEVLNFTLQVSNGTCENQPVTHDLVVLIKQIIQNG